MDPGQLIAFLVPARCPLCREPADPGALVCGDCMRALNRSLVLRLDPPEDVDRIASCADHDSVARSLLHAFKFRQMTGLAPLIAGFMADATGPAEERMILVPVPPSRLRTWLRGFDPVGLLALEISRQTGISLPASPVLCRVGRSRQLGRDRAGRLAAPPAIRPTAGATGWLGGREVILVDDVMTTGTTLTAAAGALRLAGAERIAALTFTRRL